MKPEQEMTTDERLDRCANCGHARHWHSLSTTHWIPPQTRACLGNHPCNNYCRCSGFELHVPKGGVVNA